ncbi:MAG TPA: hypothetical protein VKT77_05860 [Chthonomonadaceae bacterium]|nr:hypothetical protein [Chthonomonadaceae bacterium]
MAIKPEDKPKLIGLAVALVCVFGYVLIVLVPKLTAGASPAAHTDAPPPLTTAAAQSPAQPGPSANGEASAAIPDDETAPVPPPSRDTFMPPPAGTPQPPPGQQVKAAAPSSSGPVLGPALPAGSAPGAAGPGGIAPAAVTIQAPPIPSVELKGVILGNPAVAVLSVNGEVVERQVGDALAYGLRLAKISEEGIIVRVGKRYMNVTVGHAMLSTPPQGQPAALQQPGAVPVAQAQAAAPRPTPPAMPALVKTNR